MISNNPYESVRIVATPKVSVVVPVLNAEKTLKDCLDSLVCQDYPNYEIIIVDNGSGDRTLSIAEKFMKSSDNIIILHEKIRSRGAARRTGELAADGEIICMTDSDCIVNRDWISSITLPIRMGRTQAVQGIKIPVVKNYWTVNLMREEHMNGRMRVDDGKVGLLDTANFSISKDLLSRIGFHNEKIANGNDTELELRLKIEGKGIEYITHPVKHHHLDDMKSVFVKFIDRGKWDMIVRLLNKDNISYFQSRSPIIGTLRFAVGISFGMLTFKKQALYHATTGIGWRLGNLVAWSGYRLGIIDIK